MERLSILVFLICAVAAEPPSKMLNQVRCPRNSQPWIAALFDGWKFHCAGTLIDKQWVVTSAQCYTPRPLYVRLGEHSLLGFEPQRIATQKVLISSDNTGENVIMLLRLPTPVRIDENIQPLATSTKTVAPGSHCVLPCWGPRVHPKDAGSENVAEVLYFRNMTVLTDQKCLDDNPTVSPQYVICAIAKSGGCDSCQGTPGSPLVCDNHLGGIISWDFEDSPRLQERATFGKNDIQEPVFYRLNVYIDDIFKEYKLLNNA